MPGSEKIIRKAALYMHDSAPSFFEESIYRTSEDFCQENGPMGSIFIIFRNRIPVL
jgi:hypothetical protein